MLQEFLATCNEKLAADPGNTELLRVRALLHNLTENYHAAVADLNIVIEKRPGQADLYMLRGDSLLQLDEADKAKQDYLRALRSDNPAELSTMVESFILKETVEHPDEIEDMKKVFSFEKNNIILRDLPGFLEV